MRNPLFPVYSDDNEDSGRQPAASSPAHDQKSDNNPAAELVRQKLDRLYANEPDAKKEETEAEAAKKRSKHQEFMYRLSTSGKSLSEIQTEWHNYYANLPDKEKHEVWQEFYDNNPGAAKVNNKERKALPTKKNDDKVVHRTILQHRPAKTDWRNPADIKKQLLDKVSGGGQLKAKHHLQSLMFGLGMGFLVLFIFLFGFFNEVIIAPFIHPNQQAGATPLIVGQGSVAPNGKDEVIIPKINVEIPVDYSQTTTNEATIENALESGVVHYPTTVLPGQRGNAAFFGHSSNNIFNPGKYKFAFVLLHTLVPGDTFYLTKDHKLYSYKVISKRIVEPSEVSVLNNIAGQTATATLITCDPPGTSLHRLVVVGQQVSPNPAKNTKPTNATSISSIPANLPGNGPNLWQRYIGTIWGKILTTLIILGIAGWLVRRRQNNY